MRRISVISLAALVVVLTAPPATAAYEHLGATSNVALGIQWSQQLFPDGASTAIIVRDDSFADSLAAGALSGRLAAPVLLHPSTGNLDARVDNELSRLGATRVLIIGGTSAISPETRDDLVLAGYDVERLAGNNRVGTAVAVYELASSGGTYVYEGIPTVYLARAFGPPSDPNGSAAFADSLGAGMLAGSTGRGLLLTETDHLSADTNTALEAAPWVTDVVIVGGTAAVSEQTENELRARGLHVTRIAGATRFDTARATADQSYADGGLVALVDGLHTNSWASGYPAAGAAGGAVVLSHGDTLPAQTEAFLEANGPAFLVCAPEVGHNACVAADAALNG